MISGINERFVNKNIHILEVTSFTKELKERIESEFRVICHGEYALISNSVHFSIEESLEEFLNYRLPNGQNQKIGAIGEFLLNLLIREYTDLEIISPFFNMEERNVKKGFDIIAHDTNEDVWVIESKAGVPNAQQDASNKIRERLNTAQRDLNSRLNMKNSQLWLNAIKSVRSSVKSSDEKQNVIDLLEKASNTHASNDKNVVFAGIVFSSFKISQISSNDVEDIYNNFLGKNIYNQIKIIAIQKETYKKIIIFLCRLMFLKRINNGRRKTVSKGKFTHFKKTI